MKSRRGPSMRCRFCGEQLKLGYFSKTWNDPHYRTYHAEYSEWLSGWMKNFVIIGTIDALLLGTVLHLLYSSLTALIAVLLYSVPLYILMIRHVRRTSQFKQGWREQHPYSHASTQLTRPILETRSYSSSVPSIDS